MGCCSSSVDLKIVKLKLGNDLFFRLVLTSRSGVKTGYQRRMLASWRRKGVEVVVSDIDIGTVDDTTRLFEVAVFCLSENNIFINFKYLSVHF